MTLPSPLQATHLDHLAALIEENIVSAARWDSPTAPPFTQFHGLGE